MIDPRNVEILDFENCYQINITWARVIYITYVKSLASIRRKLRSCKFRYLFDINEGLGLLKLADTVFILINPSPSNVNQN